jgi:hypothetical protein
VRQERREEAEVGHFRRECVWDETMEIGKKVKKFGGLEVGSLRSEVWRRRDSI